MNKIYRLIGKEGRTTIPFDIRLKMRIGYNSLLSYEMKDENTIILRREKVCDHCSDHGVKEGSILDVVNSLTETEQKALHRYLSIKLSTGKEHRQCPCSYIATPSMKPKITMRYRIGSSPMRKISAAVMQLTKW